MHPFSCKSTRGTRNLKKAACPWYKNHDKKQQELNFVSYKGDDGNLEIWKFDQIELEVILH